MEVLKIMSYVVMNLAYAALTFLAISTYFKIKTAQKDIDRMERGLFMLTGMMMGENVQHTFDQVEKMKRMLNELVEKEEFEQAAKLKTMIEEAEKMAQSNLKHFESTFCEGVSCMNIKVNHINKEDPDL